MKGKDRRGKGGKAGVQSCKIPDADVEGGRRVHGVIGGQPVAFHKARNQVEDLTHLDPDPGHGGEDFAPGLEDLVQHLARVPTCSTVMAAALPILGVTLAEADLESRLDELGLQEPVEVEGGSLVSKMSQEGTGSSVVRLTRQERGDHEARVQHNLFREEEPGILERVHPASRRASRPWQGYRWFPRTDLTKSMRAEVLILLIALSIAFALSPALMRAGTTRALFSDTESRLVASFDFFTLP